MKEQDKIEFQCVLGHSGPFRFKHKHYKGSAYNLHIKWGDSSVSWEPLFNFQCDDPVTCALHSKEKCLLNTKGWTRLNKYFKEDGTTKEAPTLKAFKGRRNVVGRSSFIELAQVLTKGSEKLVTSVDCVRGVLAHNVVDVLQCIIDDHVTSTKDKKDLTRMLKNVSNFLKNQCKSHVTKDDDCDTHGIGHGLHVPDSSKMPKHYSCVATAELDNLL